MASALLNLPKRNLPPLENFARQVRHSSSMRATSFRIASFIGTGFRGLRRFIGQALRRAVKLACISLAAARATALAAVVFPFAGTPGLAAYAACVGLGFAARARRRK